MKNICILFAALILFASPLSATNYFVAESGDDANNGLDSTTAWLSLDNGDQTSVLLPGDTIYILPGTYILSSSLQLNTNGTADLPIVYTKLGDGDVVLDADGNSIIILLIEGNHVKVSGLNLTNTNDNAIYNKSDSCTISDCYIYDIGKIGIRVEGSYSLYLRNIVSKAGDDGINNEGSGEYNLYYGNTIYDCDIDGIEFKNNLSRLFNNIITANNNGINGSVENICAFNNIWNNDTDDYTGGVIDSAGGISVDPLFVNAEGDNFSLQDSSLCINTGLDLGYTYFGSAPEMGAVELTELSELIITPSYDSLFADDTYPFDVTALDDLGQPIDPGNLTWDHTFVTGTIDTDGLFTPQLIGSGKIIVESDINGITDTSEIMNVVPGSLDSLYITPDRDTISADSTRQFTATGFDSKGNTISNIDGLSWKVVRSIGTIDSTGLFDAATTGFGYIKALHPFVSLTQTDTIFVVPGEVVSIIVSPANDIVEQTESSQYSAEGYDSDSNLFGDITATATWSTTDPAGNVTAGGLYTAGNINGDYFVKAVYNSASDSGAVEVIGSGALSYIQIELLDGTPLGDTTLTTDNDTTVLYCRGYDGGDGLLGDFSADWSIIDGDSIGTVTGNTAASTEITLKKPGTGKVVAVRAGVLPDTTGIITCIPGELAYFVISPDTATITADSALQFAAVSIDADSNSTNPLIDPSWSVSGGIGSIDGDGLFTATTAGTGQIIASWNGVEDTTGTITVNSGDLSEIVISPNTIDVGIGDSVQFTADGYDAGSNPADVGELTWKILGRIGSIDENGLYITDRPGICSVQVTSSIDAITDMSSALGVEALYITNISLGNNTVYPGQTLSNLLAFRIENYYDEDKTITGITVRDASRGAGIQADRLTNYASLGLYYDIDNDSLLTVDDSLIVSENVSSGSTILSFDPITIHQGTGRTLLIGANISQFPCDADSLDLKLFPATDIETGGAESIDGPGELNSLGYNIIDGMISDQLQVVSTGVATISPGDTVYNVFTVDIPRNGYQDDTLHVFSIENAGSAAESDLDSLLLYMDDGNNTWGGTGEETRLGHLSFTGNRWTISGLTAPLNQATTRFYVGTRLSQYPNNGATIALSIPVNGLDMVSLNDGPIAQPTVPIDTISILATEAISLEMIPISTRQLLPGQNSGPILGVEMINSYPAAAVIDSFLITLYANDPDGATQALLDSQVDSISVYINRDNDYETLSITDSLIATAIISNGATILATDGLTIQGGGTSMGLSLVTWLSQTDSKNGNSINLGFQNDSDIFFSLPKTVNGSFPLKNNSDFVINAFQSSQVTMVTVDDGTYFGGQDDRLALDFTLPSNGYSADNLFKIRLVNNGTLNFADEIITAKLWADISNDGFTADDSLLGDFSSSGNFWEISELSYTVANGGARFLVTIDIAGTQFEAGTIQLTIPIQGIEYLSGMIGPDDDSKGNPVETLVFPSDRITVISIPVASSSVKPVSFDNNVLTFALYNGYVGQNQSLSGIKLTNNSHTIADLSYSDYEFGQLSLYFDADKDRLFDDDSLIAAGHFASGQLFMSGLNIDLPAESLSYFFVVADLPKEMIDSDSLTLAINGHSDLTFSQSVNINGDLPLTSGGFLIVDGSIKGQYDIVNVPPRTLSPGDTSITFFAFKPAFNGNQVDTLNSITISNIEDADDNDISQLELWLDNNGDDIWQSTDSLLTSFGYQGGDWIINSLGLEVNNTILSLFVTADIAASATPNVSFQAELPINGCQYASGNDGPIDSALVGDGVFIVSSSGIRVVPSQLNNTYSVGQSIHVEINATNILAIPIDSVIAEVVNIDNPSIVTLDSSFQQTTNLNAGESASLSFYYTADQPGEISWQLRAVAPNLPDSSAVIQTNSITIQSAPTEAMVQMINSIPTAVTKGQDNIFPFSLRLRHPDISSVFASFGLSQISIRVENSSGIGLPADEVFSRMVLSTGYSNLSILETVPAESSITFIFNQPLIISPDEEKFISILVDIDSLASADDFVLSIENSSSISPIDVNTGLAVPINSNVTFPLKTSSCNIDDRSSCMVISYTAVLNSYANYGQDNVNALRLRLRHPGVSGSSQIQLTDMSLTLIDALGDSIVATDLFDKVRLVRQGSVIAENSNLESGTAKVNLQLNSPLTLGSQEVDTVLVQVSIKESSACSTFGLEIIDSTAFTVRDLSSGSILDIITDTAFTLSTATIFPIQSGSASLKYPAIDPEFCMTDILPSTIAAGRDSLNLLQLSFNYSVGPEYSSVSVNQVRMAIQDSLGNALNTNNLFDGVGYRISGSSVVYQSSVYAYGNNAIFDLGTDGLIINPGDSLTIELIADIEKDVLYDHFVFAVDAENSIELQDATDTSQFLGLSIESECNSSFPFVSSASRIFLPADRPTLTIQTLPTQLAYPRQTDLPILKVEVLYESLLPLGDLVFSGLMGQVYRHTTNGLIPANSNQIFSDIHIQINGQTVSSVSDFSSDSLTLSLDTGYDIVRGYNPKITLLCDIQSQAALGNYVILFCDSTFFNLLDKNLAITMYPRLADESYPLRTAEISLMIASLEGSYTNYPNPFNPGIGQYTTIGYVLSKDAYIDIELFTITGEEVKRVANNSFRLAGPQQQDIWRGHNDNGFAVQPGTYYCRITARYVTGRTETFRRKIALVR